MVSDSGLMAHLLGLNQERLRERPDLAGPLLENFVMMELAKQATWSERRVSLFHFRTQVGREVDIVLEDASGDIVGLEVKASSSVKSSDFKGLRFLKKSVGERFRRGVVLYTGADPVPFGDKLTALPVSAVWQLDKSLKARPGT